MSRGAAIVRGTSFGELPLVEKAGAVRLEVHAKPRAKKSRVLGLRGDAVEISLAAPPVDGAANEELVRTLAKVFAVPKRQVVLVRGGTSQHKQVEISGLSVAAVRACLEVACAK